MAQTAAAAAIASDARRVRVEEAPASDTLRNKRRRTEQSTTKDDDEEDEGGEELRQHPYGVQPLGNAYGVSSDVRHRGLGQLAALSDELLLEILGRLEPVDLAQCAGASRALYVFANADDVWKTHVVARFAASGFAFRRSWKETLIFNLTGKDVVHRPLRVAGLFSDVLFQAWFYAAIGMRPEWTAVNNIERRSNLSLAEFIEQYEKPNKPVVITDVVTSWPAFGKWSPASLRERFGTVLFEAGPVHMSLDDYYEYAGAVLEDRPLYVFDPRFAEKAPALGAEYTTPEYFAEDFFSVLGSRRPNYRWLILGPKHSGSTWHIDPNATSAWNAVLHGRKKWIMYPPGAIPPGVHPSDDLSEVTSPVALLEWFTQFYAETKHTPVKPVECVVEAGEVIFVPSGWWHTVVNLEESIAITQNYVSSQNLARVGAFLRDKRDQVSGYSDCEHLFEDFAKEFDRAHTGKLAKALTDYDERRQRLAAPASLWRSSASGSCNGTSVSSNSGGFSFGFS
eukprot:m.29581 g.29581  ORF g.29581 m.29581 type:complete len:509 (-) comp5111_c0_seq2:77-1603(-)